jgi:hypothetical protein
MITGRRDLGGDGTNTAALAFGGYCGSTALPCTESYFSDYNQIFVCEL